MKFAQTPDERRFELLKCRVLLNRLNELSDSSLHALIIREAEEAAALARQSSYPLLVFPCLFDERAAAATERARRQARRYWNSLRVNEPALVA